MTRRRVAGLLACGAVAAVAVVTTAPRRSAAPESPRTAATARAPERAPVYVEELTPEHLDVIEKIHRQGLAQDPQVARALREHVGRYQSGSVTRAVAAAQFAAWLRRWEADNPARAAAARGRHKEAR